MKLAQFKSEFFLQLKHNYSKDEIRNLFFWLTETRLKKTKIELLRESSLNIKNENLNSLQKDLKRLKNNEPIQYILGTTEFCDMEFKVNPSVLIPRPETEELIEWITEIHQNNSSHILDIGTGSGCIAIALAKKNKNAQVTALDVSEDALKTAAENAQLNQTNIKFIQTNILNMEAFQKPYDLVVSNPPYVLENEKTLMKPNVLDHEPAVALFVQQNTPLLFYHKIAQLVAHQNKKCELFFEINEQYGEQLTEGLKEMGFSAIELKKDFLGKDRMMRAIFKI